MSRKPKAPDPPRDLTRAERNEELHRHIMEWAAHHKECRLPGCRRNRRCLYENDCRVIRDRPPMTGEEIDELNAIIRNALEEEKARREGRPWPPPDSWAEAIAATGKTQVE